MTPSQRLVQLWWDHEQSGQSKDLWKGCRPSWSYRVVARKGRHPIQDAGLCGTADFSYGVISKTTPQPPAQANPVPPAEAVPYRLPLLSNTRLL